MKNKSPWAVSYGLLLVLIVLVGFGRGGWSEVHQDYLMTLIASFGPSALIVIGILLYLYFSQQKPPPMA